MSAKAIDSPDIQSLLATRPLYSVKQVNGQRLYGPPINVEVKEPLYGSEVYVYNIPKDCFEDELVPIFESVGCIYQLRIKVVFSGDTEGYAYVKYCDPFVAQKAIQTIGRHTIMRKTVEGKTFFTHLRATISYDNKWLRMDNIPEKAIESLVDFLGAGLCKYVHNKYREDTDSGTLILLYRSHRDASMARRLWAPMVADCKRFLEWIRPCEWLKSVTAIRVRNFEAMVGRQSLNLFFCFGNFKIKSVAQVNGIAIIQYSTRWEAEHAFELCIKLAKRGQLEVCWASN